MKSNYQGIFGKIFNRTNSASRSATPTAHPSRDSFNLRPLIEFPPFDFGRSSVERGNQAASQGWEALTDRWSQGWSVFQALS
jgi:hypothetical protein